MKVHAPLGLLLLALLFSCAAPNPAPTPKPATPDSTQSPQKPALRAIDADLMVFINGRAITVALADEPREHTRGLSGVSRLTDEEGMLFVYPESERRSFWMKGCLIPLDIAFLDDEGVIQEIFTLRPPRPSEDIDLVPRANSKAPSRYVLEMRGNFFRDYGITPGAEVSFDRSLGKDRE